MIRLFAIIRSFMDSLKPTTVEDYLAEATDPKDLEARIHRVEYGQWPGVQHQLYAP